MHINTLGLTLSRRRSLLYRNQFIDLQSKSMDWLLYGRGLRYERVNDKIRKSSFLDILGTFWNLLNHNHCIKNEVFLKGFFSKCDKIRSFLRIWSHLLKKSFIENFIFCPVYNWKRKQKRATSLCFVYGSLRSGKK